MIKEEMLQRVMEKIDLTEEVSDDEIRIKIRQVVLEETRDVYISLNKKEQICNEVFYSLRRLDILQDMLEDDTITEIMINGYDKIFIEKNGRLFRTNEKFASKEKFEQVIQQVVARTNRIVNESSPIVDARLEDGSRVHVLLEPIALNGSTMTIRKFSKEITSMRQLLKLGSLNEELLEFLSIMVKARMNIFISGGTGAGKTTMLNALSNCIPKDERIITIEDSAELKIFGIENLVRLEARNANLEGANQIKIKDLIKASLRMRPDRIIVGEVRGEECIDMIQACNTGHDGSLSTGHGNSNRDMLFRLETMILMGVNLPVHAIRGQIASAFDLMIHISRLRDRSRRIVEISEIVGIENGEILLRVIYEFEETGEQQGRIEGRFVRKNQLLSIKKIKERGLIREYEKLLFKYDNR
ncbi:MAG: CpaF family protein [Lachnospiraceae bacterium]|nr:CpaF family protein [Lachnospiraceae bacterium]